MIFYFAYGSNISKKRMLIERKIDFISRKFAILKDYKLVFNKVSKKNTNLGFANIIESKGDIVEGALYILNDLDINIIDKYEGVNSNIPHYLKIYVDVICDDKIITAVTYIANPLMIKENIKPDKNYLNYLLDGKDIFSLNYYDKLISTITLD